MNKQLARKQQKPQRVTKSTKVAPKTKAKKAVAKKTVRAQQRRRNATSVDAPAAPAAPMAPPVMSAADFESRNAHWLVQPDYPLSPKLSTCISGLPAVPNGRDVLDNLLTNTIEMAAQKHHQDKKFLWSSIHNNALFRLQVLRKYPTNDHLVERIIGAGQIEELIEQQEQEMTLFQTFGNKKKPKFDPEMFRGAAPAFGSESPKCETKIFPLPEEVAKEIATGKVSLNPYHPTKPLSRKLLQHMGFADLITEEENKAYDALMTLTDEDVSTQAKNLPTVMDIVTNDIEDGFLMKRKPNGLDDEFFAFFETSPYVYPELDTKFVNNWKEAYEVHIRKL